MKVLHQLIYFYFFLVSLISCHSSQTIITTSSLFQPTWDFSKNENLSFDENFVEVKDGKVQLKALDLNQSAIEFNSGNFFSTYLDENILSVRTSDHAAVDSSWAPQYSSIIHYQPFNGNIGELANNSIIPSEIGGDMTSSNLTNSTYRVNSKWKQGVYFDGDTGAAILRNSALGVTTSVSVSLWIKLNEFNGGVQRFFSLKPELFVLRSVSNVNLGRIHFFIKTDGTLKHIQVDDVLSLNEWQHIVATWDGSSQKLYFNGDLIFEQEPGGVLSTPGSSFEVGNSGLEPMNGFVDELIIWETTLTSSEVKSIYERQSKLFSSENNLAPTWTPKWDHLVGYWTMDGHLQDSSNNGHQGGIVGDVAYDTDNQVGSQSAVFDGDDDYIDMGSSALLKTTGAVTQMAWVKPSLVTGFQLITRQGQYSDMEYGMYISNGELSFQSYDSGAGALQALYTSTQPILSGVWSHIAAVRNPDLSTDLYVNGQHLASGPSNAVPNSTSGFTIGAGVSGGGNQEFTGQIDEVAIFNTSLSHEDIHSIFNRQKQKYSAHFDSQVIDFGAAITSWPDLSWSTSLPFGKELVGDYDNDGVADAESSRNYSAMSGQLQNGLAGYWNFNEKTLGSAPGISDIKDLSGLGRHGTLSGPINLSQSGVLGHSISFSGGDGEFVTVAHHSDFESDEGSFSLWVYTGLDWGIEGGSFGPTTQGAASLITIADVNAHPGFIITLVEGQVQVQGNDPVCGSPCNEVQFRSANYIIPNQWNHITVIYNKLSGTNQRIYLNGVRNDITSVGPWSFGTSNDLIFGDRQPGTAWYEEFKGKLDEVAFWTRPLTDDEVLQLYRRGANRVKFQVKSCIDSTCACKSFSTSPQGSATDCDGDTIVNALDFDDPHKAKFIGPGGDGTTYYSEIFNRKGTDTLFNCSNNTSDSDGNICVDDEITFEAGPRPTNPVLDFSNFPLAARPQANRYFQYRTYFEADENTACSGSPCLPELSSVNFSSANEAKYFGLVQEVMPTKPFAYKAIESIEIKADDCATYQLSPDGTNYFYLSGESWVPVTTVSHSSTKNDLENNIVSFSNEHGPGLLYVKAFLTTNSDQSSNCSIHSIDVNSSDR